MFVATRLNGVLFENSTIKNGSFEDALIKENTVFRNVKMPGTHFLDAKIEGARIEKSDLQDVLFFGQQNNFSIDHASGITARITRPVAATLVPTDRPGVTTPLVGRKIANVAHMLLARIASQAPVVQAEAIDREITEFLESQSGQSSTDDENPISQRLMTAILENPSAFPNASHVFAKARTLADHIDAIVLPGGDDLPPALYGQDKAPETNWHEDYRQSVMELSLLHQWHNRGIPLLAICRGFQQSCVYLGADLDQHVGLQAGVRLIGQEKPERQDTGIFGNTLNETRVAVYHHQAVPADAKLQGAESVLLHQVTDRGKNREIVAAIESSHGAPLMAVQFHPELFDEQTSGRATIPIPIQKPQDLIESGIANSTSPQNDELWSLLAQAAEAHQQKRLGVASVQAGRLVPATHLGYKEARVTIAG
jgi:gamma-glutamyl-gamma-aminobutyrate hydrolase PuuD